MSVFHRLSLLSAHLIVRLFALFCSLKSFFSSACVVLFPGLVSAGPGDSVRLERQLKGLKRRPVHLALILAENDISYADLAKLVVWSLALGIRHMSIYDHAGTIKKNSKTLKASIYSMKALSIDESDSAINIIDKSSKMENGVSSVSNGYHKDPVAPVSVSLLSSTDGRWDIVLTAQKLAYQYRNNNKDIDDITIDKLEESLGGNGGRPCPDLAIVFGSTYSTLGFLPWHISVTEILKETSHHGLTYETYHKLLVQYSQCEQRLGK